jgi:hypothetical protein
MTIARRKIIGLFAASTATALAGCGGGGDYVPPTRFVSLLNLNPEFSSADVSIGGTSIASGLPFPGLTARSEVEYGTYTVSVNQRSPVLTQTFDGVGVDSRSPSLFVFYRHFNSTRLGSTPPGIINYFDSTVSLDVDLFDDRNVAQFETLTFEGSAAQASRSGTCQLKLYAAGSPTMIFDSGVQNRTDSILVYPRFPATSPRNGEVAVIGLNYGPNSASAVVWANLLG